MPQAGAAVKPRSGRRAALNDLFATLARTAADAVGAAWAFIGAALAIVLWALCGPLFRFSDTWQLVINTSTTIVTFLVVFLIQNAQNRDARALHLKLDELLRAVEGARTGLGGLEEAPAGQVARVQGELREAQAREREQET